MGEISLKAPLNNEIDIHGLFYNYLKEKNQYEKPFQTCIERTVDQLIKETTSANRPGMLLGKIQSGKTRTFIGIMGLAYDNKTDVVIILTKNSNALAKQTLQRLNKEFFQLIQDDQMRVFDIMSLPENLRKWELSQKLALVVKKETKNMDRIHKALFETYPEMANKRILFIDDEADFASVAYEHKKESEITEMRVISGKVDKLRQQLPGSSFLQVTATPYSLYLQPEDMRIHEFKTFQPIRPAFTELVPTHNKYVGGTMYFENSEIEGHMASYLYKEVPEKELEVLKKQDRRRIKGNDLLSTNAISTIRAAVVNFIVGGCVRRWQQENKKEKEKVEKYSFIVHTERGKASHSWQEQVVMDLEEQLRDIASLDDDMFVGLLKESYLDIKQSASTIETLPFPTFQQLYKEVKKSLNDEHLIISVVNSEKDVNELLDETGQLRLRAPLNIFIGGQILDRGITIGNLIGFYYGRNPKKFQQDTVLQHSRMYGARPLEDVAVTRFYTTKHIYDVMKRIHEFDTELRKAFEKGGHDQGVVFIQKDSSNKIIPCSPNKILLSDINVMKPHKRHLPIGFQTGYKTNIYKTVEKLDSLIESVKPKTIQGPDDAYLVPIEEVKTILRLIHSTLIMEEHYSWDIEEYISMLEYLSYEQDSIHKGYVWVITRKNRNIQRIRDKGRFEDAPDTPKGEKGELKIAKKVAEDIPAVILLRQNGSQEKGWRGTPFWWPVMVTPENTVPTVFAGKTVK